jgi:hypothetical protein
VNSLFCAGRQNVLEAQFGGLHFILIVLAPCIMKVLGLKIGLAAAICVAAMGDCFYILLIC